MNKLKTRLNFVLNKNYIYYSIYSNALFLNKKLYLLFNFWNKRKEFILLKDQNEDSIVDIIYQTFITLSWNKFNDETIQPDYFLKQTSTFSNISNSMLINFFDDNNKNKYIKKSILQLDYTIFDYIFSNYIINDKKKFFYFSKNDFFYPFYFKLSSTDNLKLKYYIYVYLYNYFYILNDNYYMYLFNYNWKDTYNNIFFNKMLLYVKFNIIKNIKKYIFLYKKNKNNIKKYIPLLKKNKNILYLILNIKYFYFFRNFINNKLKKNILYYDIFFQYIHFLKKFNKRFGKRFNKLFYRYKNNKKDKAKDKESLKLNKERMAWFLKQKFLPIIGNNIYKIFKNKNFFSFLTKQKQKNKNFFFRNFYKLNSLFFNFKFKEKKIFNKLKEKKKRKEYRILKKLKTFYYIPDIKKTKQRVYRRFKKTVLYKFRKKKKKKKYTAYEGRLFNLFIYNIKNRYKFRQKEFKLKKKSTPRFFFFKKKKNNYINFRRNLIKVGFKDLPYYLIKNYRLKIKKEEPDYFYYKKRKYKLKRCFDRIKKTLIRENKKYWSYIYRFRRKKYVKVKFFNYIRNLKKILKLNYFKKRKKNKKKYNYRNKILNIEYDKKKKNLWFFQKIVLYWKNLLKFKNNKQILNLNYINISFFNLHLMYKKFFIISIEYIKNLSFYNIIKLRKKKNYLLWFLNNIVYLFKIFSLIFYKFIKFFNKFYKLIHKLIKWNRFNRLFKKKRKRWYYKKKRLPFLIFKKKKEELLKKKKDELLKIQLKEKLERRSNKDFYFFNNNWREKKIYNNFKNKYKIFKKKNFR